MKLSETVASTISLDVLQLAIESLPGGAEAISSALETVQTEESQKNLPTV